MIKKLFAIGCLAACLTSVASSSALAKKPDLLQLTPRSVDVASQPLKGFQRLAPSRVRFGPLRFLGGLVLTSKSPYFGGFSGLTVSPDGQSMIAVTDAGVWMRAKLNYHGSRLSSVSDARIGPLLASKNRLLRRGKDRDSEAIRLVKGNLTRGTAIISFERNHRIGFFPIRGGVLRGPTSYVKLPKVHRRQMTRNKGFEAIGQFYRGPNKGRIIALAERRKQAGKPLRGWLLGRGKAKPIKVAKIDEFDATDLVTMRNGGVLLLERRFRFFEGVKMRLRYLPPEELAGDRKITGQVLLSANQSYQIDNMEGLAIHRNNAGKLVVSLISDNNFNRSLQRTLLLQFELDETALGITPRS